jgi:hypothetical protein
MIKYDQYSIVNNVRKGYKKTGNKLFVILYRSRFTFIL